MRVHNFRIDRVNHHVLTMAGRVRRNGTHHTLCAIRVRDNAQRVSSQAVGTCDRCVSALAGFTDVMDTDYDYPTRDDGTGRFTNR